MFVDRVEVFLKAGKGGDGAVTFAAKNMFPKAVRRAAKGAMAAASFLSGKRA